MQQALLCLSERPERLPWGDPNSIPWMETNSMLPGYQQRCCFSLPRAISSDGKDPNWADLELRAALSVCQGSGNCLRSLFRWCNQELCPVATEFKNSSYEAEESLMDSSLVYGSPPSTSRL